MAVRWLRKWWLPVAVIVAVLVGGGVFIAIAGDRGTIDIESSRYLLSAIVQALAALLAIIFAGVVILWTHETQVIGRLEELKDEFEKVLKSNIGNEPERKIAETIWRGFSSNEGSVKEAVLDTWKKIQECPLLTLNKLVAWYYLNVDTYDKNIAKSLNEYPEKVLADYKDCKKPHKWVKIARDVSYEKLIENVYDFFKMIKVTMEYLRYFAEENYREKLTIPNPLVIYYNEYFKTMAWLSKNGVTHLLGVIERGVRSRGLPFVLLALGYIITIAFGMGSLLLLSNAGCYAQLSCNFYLTGITLECALITVAFTFFYLYNVVRGGENA